VTLQSLIENYGYLAILLITFIEGETIVILAGIAAHLGLLELPWVIVTAIVGSVSGDQTWYYVGRHWGPKIIARRPAWQVGADKVYRHLERHQYWLILTFRFYYGLRNVTPFVIGSAQIPRLRFFALNFTGAVIWAVVFAGSGYYLGKAFEQFIDDYHRYALYVIGGLLVLGIGLWIAALVRRRILARRALEAASSNPIPPRKP